MRRAILSAAVPVFAALAVAGCGGSSNDDVPKTTGRTVPKDVTVPDEDTRITKGLGPEAAILSDAGCSFGSLPEQDTDLVNLHVSEDQLKWETNPPSSGRHLERWLAWGVYDEAIPDGNAVHNLEHGGVIVWIGSEVSDEQRSAIERLPKDGEKWIVAPRAGLDGLYSVAWDQGLDCPPDALAELTPKQLAGAVDAWFDVANSQGSPAEKDIPAYPGGVDDPAPVRDISVEP